MSRIEQGVLEYLGGRKALGISDSASALEFHERVAEGLPGRCITQFKAHSGLTNVEVSELLGVSEKTFIRWQSTPKKPIDLASSDRLYRSAKIMALAEEVLEDGDWAREWMSEPQIGLGNRVPRDLLKTDIGARHVESVLLRMEHGYLA